MAEPFLGQLLLVPYNFAPRGWAFCDGQLLSIAQNTALFSLLGTTFGGNGQTTFALPDLRGRVPVGVGPGPGLSPVDLGEVGGSETVTLITTQIPAHGHTIGGTNSAATGSRPAGNVNAQGGAYSATSDATMQPTGNTGGSQPHGNLQPYLALNWCIALEGIFPSRN
jgi:microcystin-dependent protein